MTVLILLIGIAAFPVISFIVTSLWYVLLQTSYPFIRKIGEKGYTITYYSLLIGLFIYSANVVWKLGLLSDVVGINPDLHVYTLILFAASLSMGNLVFKLEIIVNKYLQTFSFLNKKTIMQDQAFVSSKQENNTRWWAMNSCFSLIEEFVWRGCVITILNETYHMGLLLTLSLSALLFGINHYYFGFKQILTKSISGLLFGGLLITTGHLIFPIIAHMQFNRLYRTLRITKAIHG